MAYWMNDSIKFNIIIPTRERADTLFHCLRTVVAQEYENLRIIVSDNFSQDNTRDVVDSFADPRIMYINTGKRVSMSHNWEFALSHVTDGWVTFLGDDDGMLPEALKRIEKIIKKTGMSAVTSIWKFYFWPHSTDAQNQLTVPLSTGYEIRNGMEWLAKVMKGEANYFDLPWVYTGGFVDIELINKAKNENGNFFCSMIPDAYSAVALASIVNQFVMVFEPACVMGVSTHSAGASVFASGTSSKSNDIIASEPNIPFHSMLILVSTLKSIHISVYECYLQAEHLHKNILNIDMLEQLTLALSKVSRDYYDDFSQYCKEVAANDNVSFNADKFTFNMLDRIYDLVSLSLQDTITVNASKYGVKNIYDATLLSNKLYLDNATSKYKFICKYIRLVKKILRFIFTKFCNKATFLNP